MARLTAAQRKALPSGDFAGPHRSYPIQDAAHARDALARSAGKSEHAAVVAAVHHKYPSISISSKG